MTSPHAPTPVVPEDALTLAEALIFPSTEPVSVRRPAALLADRQTMPA